MKKKHHTPEQIVSKLREVEALTAEGATIAQATKQIGVSEQTIYRWKKQYGGMDRDELGRLRKLEKENARLKKLVADLTLDKDILKEALEGKWIVGDPVARRVAAMPCATSRRRSASASGGPARPSSSRAPRSATVRRSRSGTAP